MPQIPSNLFVCNVVLVIFHPQHRKAFAFRASLELFLSVLGKQIVHHALSGITLQVQAYHAISVLKESSGQKMGRLLAPHVCLERLQMPQAAQVASLVRLEHTAMLFRLAVFFALAAFSHNFLGKDCAQPVAQAQWRLPVVPLFAMYVVPAPMH